MIQDIAPKKLHNEYRPKEPHPDNYAVIFCENKILMKETEAEKGKGMCLPRIKELAFVLGDTPGGARAHGNAPGTVPDDSTGELPKDARARENAQDWQYLFAIDEDSYFLYMDFELPEDGHSLELSKTAFRFVKMSEVRYQADKELCFAAYTACHLYQWYRSSRYCGRCGRRVKPDGRERMLYCENCGNQIYPKIAPAVIAAVTDGDRILLSKYANREYKRYALIAGFTEIGETAEETVRREVMEEVGLRVKNIRYYKTQPWGIDGNLLIGYFAQLDGEDTVRIDKNELAVAEWVHRDELKDMDDGFSLTREMMRVFYEGLEI